MKDVPFHDVKKKMNLFVHEKFSVFMHFVISQVTRKHCIRCFSSSANISEMRFTQSSSWKLFIFFCHTYELSSGTTVCRPERFLILNDLAEVSCLGLIRLKRGQFFVIFVSQRIGALSNPWVTATCKNVVKKKARKMGNNSEYASSTLIVRRRKTL